MGSTHSTSKKASKKEQAKPSAAGLEAQGQVNNNSTAIVCRQSSPANTAASSKSFVDPRSPGVSRTPLAERRKNLPSDRLALAVPKRMMLESADPRSPSFAVPRSPVFKKGSRNENQAPLIIKPFSMN
jgi:hypothetical protein